MGRRKIEIKAIKDDRNRSVTFLKRKGGLFKKAHELSVLCSVDVAVIIFGQNKKLYEYCSSDMPDTLMRYHYYQGPHERKGPGDYGERDDDDDDDDDQAGSPGPEDRQTPPNQNSYLSSQPGNQHLRHGPPPGSPPVQNGIYAPRMSTPQPQNLSRPSSRAHRRVSSHLVPMEHANNQNAPPQASYGPYHQNPSYYHPGAAGHAPQIQMHQHQGTPPPPQHQPQHHAPPQQQQQPAFSHPAQPARSHLQQMFMQEQRRQSMPPAFPGAPHERPQSVPTAHPSPPQLSRPFQSPPLPGSPKLAAPVASRTHSIYTPVDDRRSILAQHWEAPRHSDGDIRPDVASQLKEEPGVRSQSIDNGSTSRHRAVNGMPPQSLSYPQPGASNRTGSPIGSSAGSAPNTGTFPPPSRVNSLASDAKRPRLTVQIPSEHSDNEAATAATGATPTSAISPREGGATATTANAQNTPSKPATVTGQGATSSQGSAQSRSTGSVVLPPPSPSANSASASGVLSAGATGPKNPFARPLPPHAALNTSVGGVSKEALETATPMSALPSRFMSDNLLPSPSSFYPDWSFGATGSGNTLASPALYQPTPVKETGGGWRDEDRERERLGKRKNSHEDNTPTARDEKKVKS